MRLSGAGGTYGWEGGGGGFKLTCLAVDWVEGVEGRGVRSGSVCDSGSAAGSWWYNLSSVATLGGMG